MTFAWPHECDAPANSEGTGGSKIEVSDSNRELLQEKRLRCKQ